MSTTPPPTYPNCEKLVEAGQRHRAILEFLEWVEDEKGVSLAEWLEDPEFGSEMAPISGFKKERLALEFFEIDPDAYERELKALLEAEREANR